jgi:hypothetical protein
MMEVTAIENLLLDDFPVHFNILPKASINDLNVQEHQNEEFSINDDKACKMCEKQNRRSCITKEVAKFKAGIDKVLTIDVETFLLQYDGSTRLRNLKCDLLHVDSGFGQFVLNELTCTIPEYVNPYDNTSGHHDGKRIKAQLQLTTVADLFLSIPNIASYIAAFDKKVALFSWRNPLQEDTPTNIAEESMQLFGLPDQAISNITTISTLRNGFTFVQQLYPSVYLL